MKISIIGAFSFFSCALERNCTEFTSISLKNANDDSHKVIKSRLHLALYSFCGFTAQCFFSGVWLESKQKTPALKCLLFIYICYLKKNWTINIFCYLPLALISSSILINWRNLRRRSNSVGFRLWSQVFALYSTELNALIRDNPAGINSKKSFVRTKYVYLPVLYNIYYTKFNWKCEKGTHFPITFVSYVQRLWGKHNINFMILIAANYLLEIQEDNNANARK